MAYCTQADIEAIFGTANVATWSNLGNSSTTADTNRIAAAIEEADAEVDGRFRGSQYALPLATATAATPMAIKVIAARIAGASLYESRSIVTVSEDETPTGSKVAAARREAHRSMDRYLSGRASLDAVKEGTGSVGPFSVA